MIRHLCLAGVLIAGPAAAQSQGQLNLDEDARFRRADAALNAQYRAAMAEAKADDATAAATLLASQRAWIQFRDTECRRIGHGYRGGSMQPMQISGCKAQLTEQRTQQLKGDPH